MIPAFRAGILIFGEHLQHILDLLGRKVMVRKNHAAIERFGKPAYQSILKAEKSDPFYDGRPSLPGTLDR